MFLFSSSWIQAPGAASLLAQDPRRGAARPGAGRQALLWGAARPGGGRQALALGPDPSCSSSPGCGATPAWTGPAPTSRSRNGSWTPANGHPVWTLEVSWGPWQKLGPRGYSSHCCPRQPSSRRFHTQGGVGALGAQARAPCWPAAPVCRQASCPRVPSWLGRTLAPVKQWVGRSVTLRKARDNSGFGSVVSLSGLAVWKELHTVCK